MALRFHNTLTRQLEEYVPLHPGEVRLYTCGPTVYNYAHIGNLRTYIFEDLLVRYLRFRGFKVTQVMNLTDVDDKTIRNSQQEGIPLRQFTDRYSAAFFEDIKALNVSPAQVYPRATEHIPEMIALIKKLLEKGYAYRSEDNSIYYSIAKFPHYGQLAHIDVSELQAGARVKQDEYGKEQLCDFVLWKAWDENDGPVFWETELGKGRPGWHIECSAMSTRYLGNHFDLHTGGVDNIFPHHENEIAQSEAATGEKFVNYWLHSAHLIVEGKKMSKSLGNFFTLRDLLQKGHSPRAIRWLLISSHYSQQLNFTFSGLEAAGKTIASLDDFIARLQEYKNEAQNFPESDAPGQPGLTTQNYSELPALFASLEAGFTEHMDNDLGISAALAVFFDFVTKINSLLAEKKLSTPDAQAILAELERYDSVFGVLDVKKEKELLPEEIEKLIQERESARKQKDWKRSDKIRDQLKAKGILLEDTKEGLRWKKA